MHAITMPRWGMTMTEGTVAAWLVAEGETVAPGREILEIETSKITNVVEAAATGVLRRRVVPQGASVPVGALLGVIADAALGETEIDAFVAGFAERAGDIAAAPDDAAPDTLVAAGAYRLNARIAGHGGSPIVLLHGFGGEISTWLFNQPELATSHRVIALDLPAHGGSDPVPIPDTIEDLADAVAAALQALSVSKAHVVGHSLGGALAILLAERRPELVASLVLIAPVGLGQDIDPAYVVRYLGAERRQGMAEALAFLFAEPSRITREMVDTSLRTRRLDGVADALTAIAAMFVRDGTQALDLRGTLDRIAVPVRLIWGDADRVVPPPEQHPVHRVAGAGHMPHMERPAEVNREIAAHAAAAGRAPG